MNGTPAPPLARRGMLAVLVGQGLSTLGDNAVLFAAISALKHAQAPSWHIPFLQEFFVGAFILLAPFVGPFADAQPKGRVLMQGALLRLAGALSLFLGLNPFLAYGVIGLGAALSSPAKSGILAELCAPGGLVRANSWLEASNVVALLVGAIAGATFADDHARATVGAAALVYAAALAATAFVPRLTASRPMPLEPGRLVAAFLPMVGRLMRCAPTRVSLLGTAMFWGMAAVLRFLLLAWLPVALGFQGLTMAGYLTGATGLGVALGAVLAGQVIRIESIPRVLPAGIAMGLTIASFAAIHTVAAAVAGLMLVGILGGFFLVPMNALLQEHSPDLVGAGGAIAVQNLIDNLGMLLLVAVYLVCAKAGATPIHMALGVGLAMALMSGALLLHFRSSERARLGIRRDAATISGALE